MKGKYYALNFPLRDGISDENYKSVFEPVCIIFHQLSSELTCLLGYSTSHGVLRPVRHCAPVRY